MFLESTPNTSGYMIAGYVVVFTVLGIYLFSMYIRNRNLKQDLEILEAMQVKQPRSTKVGTKPKPKKK